MLTSLPKQITIITIIGGCIFTIPRFRAPKWRFVRAVVFGIILLSGAVPMTHAARHFGRAQAAQQMGWWFLVTEACLYVFGAVIYAVTELQLLIYAGQLQI